MTNNNMEQLEIYIVSWNVGAKFPSEDGDMRPLLGLELTGNTYLNVPDIYVIGLQEVKAQPQNIVMDSIFEDPWTGKCKEVLGPLGLVKVQTTRLQGLITSVFMKRTHLTFIRDIEYLYTKRGFGGFWGNKGAISLRFGLHGCSICLVNSHLTPHDHSVEERIQDYKSILTTQIFSQPETSNILYHDYVFWFGDLNFRLDGIKTSERIMEMVSQGLCEDLLKEDQLARVRKSGDAFSELNEMELTFPPTYKFEDGVDNYDPRRRPGWTDRVLYQVNANAYDNVTLGVECLSYRAHINYRASDHRAVTASFKIKVFRPTIQKMVEFTRIRFWNLGQSNKVFYKICPTLETSVNDWIAIFKDDFTSLQDYVAYVYVPSNHSPEESSEIYEPLPQDDDLTEKCVVFSENSIPMEGNYIVMYISHPPRSVYAISDQFKAVKCFGTG